MMMDLKMDRRGRTQQENHAPAKQSGPWHLCTPRSLRLSSDICAREP